MLAMTLLVKNELDVVGANIDFHLNAGVDHIVVTDNASDDGTRDLLADYDRLEQVTVWDELGDDMSQSRWVTSMALYAAQEMGADWILNGDADEFWLAPHGNLPAAVKGSAAHVLMCPRFNMSCGHDTASEAPWWERLVYRPRSPLPKPRLVDPLLDPLPGPYFTFALPGTVAVRGEGLVRVRAGNHKADYDFPVKPQPAPVVVYHYPVRSRAQFETKIRLSGAAYTRNRELHPTAAWHCRRWYKMMTEQPGGIEAALAEALPSSAAIAAGLADGSMLTDHTLVAPLGAITAASPAAQPLATV
jgi:hypothetical protein